MKQSSMVRTAAMLLAFVASAPLASHGAEAQARRFASSRQGVFGGQKLRYSAIVEENFITNAAGKRTASLFTTSYIRTDVPKGTQRPVMFVFNGGPGSASICSAAGQVDAANKFITEEYLHALHAGSRLTDAQRDSVVKRPATLTGLTPAVVRENNLRINAGEFARSLLADQRAGQARRDFRASWKGDLVSRSPRTCRGGTAK